MERGKIARNKKKPLLKGELFALGTKTREDNKPKHVVFPVVVDLKQETNAIFNTKKLKLNSPRVSDDNVLSVSEYGDFLRVVEIHCESIGQCPNDVQINLLCSSLRNLSASLARPKPDPVLYLTLLYMAKMQPELYSNEATTSVLTGILRRESRQCVNSHAIAANLLAKAFCDKKNWPEVFMRTYIDDAINDRTWADNEFCVPFIENICASFQTRIPKSSLLEVGASVVMPNQQRDSLISIDDDSGDNSLFCTDANFTLTNVAELKTFNCAVEHRYINKMQAVEKYVIDAIRDQFNKRQQQDCHTRNILKFLCSTSGLEEVRLQCITRLELWIHNGKLVKIAQKLLSYVCVNIKSNCSKDHDVLGLLVKVRLKTKPLINFYMACLKEMITLQPDVLCIILKLVVQNELSNTRNPNNMAVLATMFQTSPDESASNLAEIYKDFLLQREDCLRTLRVFLRELVRMLRYDMNIVVFCKVLLTERPEFTQHVLQSEHKDRIFQSMIDILCLCVLVSVSPNVREANMSLRSNRDIKNNATLLSFCSKISQIQLDAVSWMYETVPRLFQPTNTDYNQALHKLLLLESAEQYSRCDQWPSEPERGTLLRMVSETPIHEETLLRIILIGITKDIPFTIPETIDIIMLVIKRASTMRIKNYPAVQANKFDIIDFLFSMSEYHFPENIKLPIHYEPPKLAITILYWKAWIIMLMISAHNPSTFGAFCWDHYPTLKMLIEMCITNQFSETAMGDEELQILTMERNYILELESYLAAQTSKAIITEETAILTSQLMLLDPIGPARKVPLAVLDQLKYLNKTLKLGHLLCRSRKPDLLLDIIQRQGTTQSMPWLSDLVQNSEADLNHLPVQCLCEFLLFNAYDFNEQNSREAELINFLRNLLEDPNSNKETVCEVMDYIFRRLSSTVTQIRKAALKGMQFIFECSEKHENDWLVTSIPKSPHFSSFRAFVIPQLRSACQVENSPEMIMFYIQFIAANTLTDSVKDMLDTVMDMAQLIVERSTMFQHIVPFSELSSCKSHMHDGSQQTRIETLKCLFVLFNNYIIKMREHGKTNEWLDMPDLVMVQFNNDVHLPLHLNIIHAFIILLTYSSNVKTDSSPFFDYWFPQDSFLPDAYPNLSNQPVQLLPDWLKLRMVRSPVDRLIKAALHNISIDQIVLFVQNFGTPIKSVSKLLALLDRAVIEQFEVVSKAILNKAYLAQLIEIQQARGAKNGHFSVEALGLYSPTQAIFDLPKVATQRMESLYVSRFETKESSLNFLDKNMKTTEEVFRELFSYPRTNVLNGFNFRIIIHKLLEHDRNYSKHFIHINIIDQSYKLLIRFVEQLQMPNFDQTMLLNDVFTFYRAVLQKNSQTEAKYNTLYYAIKDAEKMNENLITERNDKKRLHYLSSLLSVLEKTKAAHNLDNLLSSPKVYMINLKIKKLIAQYRIVFQSNKMDYKMEDSNLESSGIKSVDTFSNGLLVDWLVEMDPELLFVSHNDKINFLFSNSSCGFRFFLLSLICHQSNWKTLVSSLNYVLRDFHIDFDCNTVLNFIDFLINNPKICQGNDSQKITEIEFTLSDRELQIFTQFILKEAESQNNNFNDVLCSRINLLLTITNKDCTDLIKFVEFVLENPCSWSLKLKVIHQMYVVYPSVKFIRCCQIKRQESNILNLPGCEGDKVLNYLITCMGNLRNKKDFEALSSDTELLIRKIASSHPILFLRHLSVLSSLIDGRAETDFQALKDEYHFHRFIQIITFELLQPVLFEDSFKQEFQTFLVCYLSFFKQQIYIKDSYHFLYKLVELLQTYINVNPSAAIEFLEKHEALLSELADKFNLKAPLHQLLQGISFMQHNRIPSLEQKTEDIGQATGEENTDGAFGTNVIVPHLHMSNKMIDHMPFSVKQIKTLTISTHFSNLIKIVKHSCAEDAILGPLQEIESLTSKQYSFISELFERLLELIFSPHAQIRFNAFILLIRHLKYNPGDNDVNRCSFNAYIQCLRDENSSVAATAIDNLAEITMLLHEYAVEILSVAFSLGVRSQLNTSSQIRRVFQIILLQQGY